MLAVTSFMYTVSAVHWATNMVIAARSLRADTILVTPLEMVATSYLPMINVRHLSRFLQLRRMLIAGKYILSDGIVVWRAWAVWGPSRRLVLFTPPFLSLVCTLGEQHNEIAAWLSRLTDPFSVLAAVGAAYMYLSDGYQLNRQGLVSRYLGLSIWAFSVGTNLWATSLICIRMWHVSSP